MIDPETATTNAPYAFNIFSMVFGVAYTVCFYFNYALFRYYPQVGEFHLGGEQPASSGPPIFCAGGWRRRTDQRSSPSPSRAAGSTSGTA
jgi:hypothetical protein